MNRSTNIAREREHTDRRPGAVVGMPRLGPVIPIFQGPYAAMTCRVKVETIHHRT